MLPSGTFLAVSGITEYLASISAPLMIGGVALVAYISLRGVHLSKRTREVLENATGCASDEAAVYAFQLERLARRHAINSCALVFAILAVMLFGTQLALVSLSDRFGFASDAQELREWCIILGGFLAAGASLLSVWETIIAPPSLRTAVAAGVVKLAPKTDADRKYAILLAERVLGFDETKLVGRALRLLRGEVMPDELRARLCQQIVRWRHPEFRSPVGSSVQTSDEEMASAKVVNHPR